MVGLPVSSCSVFSTGSILHPPPQPSALSPATTVDLLSVIISLPGSMPLGPGLIHTKVSVACRGSCLSSPSKKMEVYKENMQRCYLKPVVVTVDGAACLCVTTGSCCCSRVRVGQGCSSVCSAVQGSPHGLCSSSVSSAKAGKPCLQPERDTSHFITCGGGTGDERSLSSLSQATVCLPGRQCPVAGCAGWSSPEFGLRSQAVTLM